MISIAVYTVLVTRPTRKQLNCLTDGIRQRIISALLALEVNPRTPASRKLEGAQDAYLIRIGTYRVLYVIADDHRTIEI